MVDMDGSLSALSKIFDFYHNTVDFNEIDSLQNVEII